MNYELIEVFFNGFAGIDILKDPPFLSLIVLHDLFELPSEMNLNVSLSALFESDFICIVKIKD